VPGGRLNVLGGSRCCCFACVWGQWAFPVIVTCGLFLLALLPLSCGFACVGSFTGVVGAYLGLFSFVIIM